MIYLDVARSFAVQKRKDQLLPQQLMLTDDCIRISSMLHEKSCGVVSVVFKNVVRALTKNNKKAVSKLKSLRE